MNEHQNKLEAIEDTLARYKVSCSCPKGGIVGGIESAERACDKCDGMQFVLPGDIRQALKEAYTLGQEAQEESQSESWEEEEQEKLVRYIYTDGMMFQAENPQAKGKDYFSVLMKRKKQEWEEQAKKEERERVVGEIQGFISEMFD